MTNIISAITLPELVPIFSAYGAMLVGFYALVKFILNKAEEQSNADRVERQALSDAITKMADPEINGNKAIADGIIRQADESKERNGHLAEIAVDNKDAILEAIKGIRVNQRVKEQSVEHQVVKEKL